MPLRLNIQLQGTLTRDSAPGSRLGLRSQTPIIGLRSALAMCPPHRSLEGFS